MGRAKPGPGRHSTGFPAEPKTERRSGQHPVKACEASKQEGSSLCPQSTQSTELSSKRGQPLSQSPHLSTTHNHSSSKSSYNIQPLLPPATQHTAAPSYNTQPLLPPTTRQAATPFRPNVFVRSDQGSRDLEPEQNFNSVNDFTFKSASRTQHSILQHTCQPVRQINRIVAWNPDRTTINGSR